MCRRISFIWISSCLLLFCVEDVRTSSRRLHYKVTEGRGSRKIIANIAQELGIAGERGKNHYRLSSPTRAISDLLRINEITSDLSVVSEIDRDRLCERYVLCCEPEGSRTTDSCTIAFKVTYTSDDKVEFCSVELLIEDINDRSPQFDMSHFTLDIPESSPIGSQFDLPRAVDFDGGINGIQSYRIENGHGLFLARAHRIVGGQLMPQLELHEGLDRETVSSYEMVLIAVDGGSPPKSGTLQLTVRVQDSNDNAPDVDPAISIVVKEDAPVNSIIGHIKATDLDAGDNSRLTYRKTNSAPDKVNRLFQIDPSTGSVKLIHRLDFDIGAKSYTIPVIVSDNGKPPRSASTSVVVSLIDVNDEAPQISITDLHSHIPPTPEVKENKPPSSFVAFVNVKDLDSGANGDINCIVHNGAFSLEAVDGISHIRANDYKLVTSRSLDREKSSEEHVTIECKDNGSPQKISQKTVVVKIVDENDNAPKFASTTLNISIRENKHKGTYVAQLNASDADEDAKGQGLTYSLSATGERYFRIDAHNGRLYSLTSFDREMMKEVKFQVTAKDSGKPSKNTTASVTVHILDENDCDPRFGQDVFQFNIDEEQEIGHLVGVISVTDDDEGDNGRYLLQIDDSKGVAQNVFRLDPKNGRLTTIARIDRETQDQYEFKVTVRDRAMYKPRSSEARVVVIVNDVNDNKPKFVYPTSDNHTVYSSVYNRKGTEIVKVTAVDDDVDNHGGILFLITRGNERGLFDLDPKTGVITLVEDLKESDTGKYTLFLEARDNGSPTQSTPATITVVLDTTSPRQLQPYEFGPGYPRRQLGTDRNLILVICLVVIATVLAVIFLFIIVWLKRKPSAGSHGRGGAGGRQGARGQMMLRHLEREKREIQLASLQAGSRSTLPIKSLVDTTGKDGFSTVKFGHPSVMHLGSDDAAESGSLQSFGCHASIDSGRGGSHDQISGSHKGTAAALAMQKETNANYYQQISCFNEDGPPAYTLPTNAGNFRHMGRRHLQDTSTSRECDLDDPVGNYQTLNPVSTFPSLKVTVTAGSSASNDKDAVRQHLLHDHHGTTIAFKPVSLGGGGDNADYTSSKLIQGNATTGRKPYSVYTSSFV